MVRERIQILYSGSPCNVLALGLHIVPWVGVVTFTWRLKILANKR